MGDGYQNSLKFAYKKYKRIREVKFTEEIKSQFELFFKDIISLEKEDFVNKADKAKKELLISDLADKYKVIRNTYIKPVVEKVYNYKSTAYTQEEVDFIFICSYWLIDKAGLPQDDIAKVFGIPKNKFSKWGCYPQRCHDAFTKLDNQQPDCKQQGIRQDALQSSGVLTQNCNKSGKPLIPNDYESAGIQAARCINKNIQAVYACSAFVGVSNDLDLFANISSTDTKKYVLTYPSERTESDTPELKMKSAMAYARFLFATANNLENIPGQYKADAISKKIVQLLKMKDNAPIKYSSSMEKLLNEGTEYKKFLSTADDQCFERILGRYRALMDLLPRVIDDSYDPDELEYSEGDEYIQNMFQGAEGIDFYDADSLLGYLEITTEQLRKQLLKQMSYAGIKTYDEDLFTDYKLSMRLLLGEKNTKIEDINEKVELAAIFWVLQVLGIGATTQKERDAVLEYFDPNQLLGYVDSLNKEAKGEKNIHLAWEPDNFDIGKLIEKLGGSNKNILQPVLVYIDTDAYHLSKEYITELLQDYNIVLVVHDTVGIAKDYGMQPLDGNLNLYAKEHGDGNI